MFDIISLGRMDFLIAILNGLAMITADDGPAGYGGLVALGLLVGVLIAIMRGVVTQKLELQWVLAGWLLFVTMFGPKVTVTVEDIYTGTTQTVANVPLGPAAIGSITSTVGITLAEAFETVFAYPTMTNAGYMDALDLINAMRDMDYGSANDGSAAATVANVDLQKTLREYLVKCVMKSISMGIPGAGPNGATLRESDELLADIRVNTNIWPTTVYLDSAAPNGTLMGCADAYTQIANFVNATFVPAWEQYIGAQLGLSDTNLQMQDALDAIFGLGASAQNYMLNSLLKREMDLAEIGYHAAGGNDAGVLMRVQAMEQRRVQWASEQSMWAEMARPAISFIEGLFYAASILMGFIFCLGAPGVAVFGKYLLFAIWIQLWMPILAVTNLYVTIAASTDLQRLQAGGTNLLTMTGLDSVWTQTSSWLAFGGNMVAATPLLTFILITGSYFALTRLTDRLGGADHINERIQAPDIMNPAPLAAVGGMGVQTSQFANDPMHGTHTSGSAPIAGTVSIGSQLNSAAQSRSSAVMDSVQRLMRENSSGVDYSRRDQFESYLNSAIGDSTRSSRSETDQVLRSLAMQVVGGRSRFDQLSSADQATIQGAIALGLKGAGSGAGIDGMLSNVEGAIQGERNDWAKNIQNVTSHNAGTNVELARAITSDEQSGARSSVLRALGVQDSERWSRGISTTQSAVESYEEVKGLQDTISSVQNLDALTIGHRLGGSAAGEELYVLATSKYGYGEEVDRLKQILVMQAGVENDETATTAAAMRTLIDSSPESAVDAARVISQNLAAPQVDVGKSATNTDVRSTVDGSVSDAESLKDDVVRNLAPVGRTPEFVRSSIDGPIDAASPATQRSAWRARGDDVVNGLFNSWLTENREDAAKQSQEFERIAGAKEAEHLHGTFQDTRSFLKTLNEEGWMRQIFPLEGIGIMKEAGTEAGASYRAAYDDIYESTGSRIAAATGAALAAAQGFYDGGGNFHDKLYTEAFKAARSEGVPEVAAHYFAASRVLSYSSGQETYTGHEGLWKDSPRMQQLEREAESVVGKEGVTVLQWAATGDDRAEEKYLPQAAGFGRALMYSRALGSDDEPALAR